MLGLQNLLLVFSSSARGEGSVSIELTQKIEFIPTLITKFKIIDRENFTPHRIEENKIYTFYTSTSKKLEDLNKIKYNDIRKMISRSYTQYTFFEWEFIERESAIRFELYNRKAKTYLSTATSLLLYLKNGNYIIYYLGEKLGDEIEILDSKTFEKQITQQSRFQVTFRVRP